MPNPTFILCPGQGAQLVGMGRDFATESPSAADVFKLANGVLGFDVRATCFDGPEERLNQTDMSQPAIYVTGVAAYRAAIEAGVVNPAEVTAFAGLSLGEYTALYLAGVFTFDDGLRLVRERGRFMQEAATVVPSGMVALLGADEATAQQLCDGSAEGEVLVLANYNAPGQIVVSGHRSACDRVLKAAETAGLKATALKVAGAFHSPLMQPAADRMRAELDAVRFSAPTTTVYSNVTAAPHGDEASIKDLLVQQIVSPVKWSQTMQTLIATGGDAARFVELAPNRHLAGLAKRINRRLPVESLATVEAMNALKETYGADVRP